MRPRIEGGEDMRRGSTELERSLGCDRFDVRHSADAVRSKDFFRSCHATL
jgi:hypothetical protein